jgi:hypothetical protein
MSRFNEENLFETSDMLDHSPQKSLSLLAYRHVNFTGRRVLEALLGRREVRPW